MICRYFLIPLLLLAYSAHAEIVTLPSEQEVNIEEYGNWYGEKGNGDNKAKHLVLWMHSERGISAELQKNLLGISQKQNIRILMPDWLDSYYITSSRSALEKIPQQDVEDLISHYSSQLRKPTDKLFIVASGRMNSLVLNATHHLQTQGNHSLGGIIMVSPYLHKGAPEIGKPLSYQNITAFSNLPLYIFQAERSPRFVPHFQLVKALEKGGSSVYSHILANVSGGFHARDIEDLTEADLEEKRAFPKQFSNALSLLQKTPAAPIKKLKSYTRHKRIKRLSKLQQMTVETKKLVLNDIHEKPHHLDDYKGKIVLVSFWASWCGPCIEEMPSLVKLKEKYKDQLEILAVNVREDTNTITKFTKIMNINFPLLQDFDAQTTEDWKVYVYPSNYIIDKTGKTRYAATGAMDWQDIKIDLVLQELIAN